MPRRWIRLDAEWDESPWIDALSSQAAGCWPRLLCWVKLRGVRGRCKAPSPSVLARRWRVARQAVIELMDAAQRDGAVRIEGGEMEVVNWEEYQPTDRTVTDRVRRFRERQRENETTVTPLHPVTPSLSTSESSDDDEPSEKRKEKPRAPTERMHEIWVEELGGSPPHLKLSDKRKRNYTAFYCEQLKDRQPWEPFWRATLWAVKASDFHMSKRQYQQPESFLRDTERRETWFLAGLEHMNGSAPLNEADRRLMRRYEEIQSVDLNASRSVFDD